MAIDYDALMEKKVEDELCVYTEKDAMLYALGVGFGSDPLDLKELPYVYEGASLKTVPTLASMLLPSTFLDKSGWDYDQVLHSELTLDLYRPLPPSARLLTNRRVVAVHDRGAKKGARIRMESEVRLAKDDTVLFTLGNTLLARGDGGFGGSAGQNPLPHKLPKRAPDMTCDLKTRPDQALLFRLCGDLNPRRQLSCLLSFAFSARGSLERRRIRSGLGVATKVTRRISICNLHRAADRNGCCGCADAVCPRYRPWLRQVAKHRIETAYVCGSLGTLSNDEN